ncbi:MAG: tRNA (adenosine(37)-N6)-threonylcarbamoyltransferase complex ATPase subunit type 1 TsaE [Hyphomonas sp.]
MEILFDLDDDAATRALGAALAGLLQTGDVIALHGELGAGKTTLTRGLVQALCGADEDVPSPTYTLVQAYDAPDFPLWHFDLYRLGRPEDVNELGWDDTQDGVAVIEWPARAGRYLPAVRLDLTLEMLGEQRRARLEPVGEDWQKRLDGFRFSPP